ncbi:MAG: tetratricopeptide repeat protein, partial [Planctomycetota bacterium]
MTTAIPLRTARTFSLAGIASVLLLALPSGCASPGGGDAVTSGYSSTFQRLLDKERKGEYADALEAYRAMARDTGRPFTERIRALVRAARCLEERKQPLEARKAYEEVLSLPRLMANENHLPVEGEVDIHLRLQAEDGL